jgi:hypothetical protein
MPQNQTIPSIRIGALVRIYNHEHIWHGEIGIIRDIKNIGFCRVEMLGKLIWVPQHWLVIIND